MRGEVSKEGDGRREERQDKTSKGSKDGWCGKVLGEGGGTVKLCRQYLIIIEIQRLK